MLKIKPSQAEKVNGSIINSVGEKITDTILFNKKGVTFRNS